MGELIQGPWKPRTDANLSKVQIARELGRSRKTIERWMAVGMPHERTRAGHARFNLQAVLNWMQQRESA